ncbi:helix-turn-helix domain-containing protein [Glutamicibacter sp. PS]|uniref:IclR family transcriptional regulator n=1 Tax=Glutamicibacter sp. PS TaxID=3075634 RepID=UPI002852B67E|nr:helix-turn-helix domain-containing protein [Glutamicibacter sp. PS]
MTDRLAGSEGSQDESPQGPQTVHRALEVLTLVVDRGPLALSDIARASKLPTSTTSRMLRVLEHWGYVSRARDGQYSLGPRFVQSRVVNDQASVEDLVDASGPIMSRLTEQTSESSYLAVPSPANTCTFLREVQSSLPIRYVGFDGWEGRTVPMGGSVTGEVLDGRIPDLGYVVMVAVQDPDATVIGAPVRNAQGQIIAALSIAGPSFRMGGQAVAALGEAVSSAATELAEQINSRASQGASKR